MLSPYILRARERLQEDVQGTAMKRGGAHCGITGTRVNLIFNFSLCTFHSICISGKPFVVISVKLSDVLDIQAHHFFVKKFMSLLLVDWGFVNQGDRLFHTSTRQWNRSICPSWFVSLRIVVMDDRKTFFNLPDVCQALTLANVTRVKMRMSKRGVITADTPTSNQFGASVLQPTSYIDKPNLYRRIFMSRKAEAWIRDESGGQAFPYKHKAVE